MNSAFMPPPMNLGVMAWLKEQATATFVQGSDRERPLEHSMNLENRENFFDLSVDVHRMRIMLEQLS